MTAQPDFDRFLESWLADGPSELSDRAASRIVQAIDDSQRGPTWLPRRETMNRFLVAAGSVAAIALIAVIGIGLMSGGGLFGPGATTSPTSSPEPTAPPSPEPTAAEPSASATGDLPEAYVGHPLPAPNDSLTLTYDVPEGWDHFDEAVLAHDPASAPDGTAIQFIEVTALESDPCHWLGSTNDLTIGPAVDDLVEALRAQTAYEVSDPVDATIGGYSGTRVDLLMPTDLFPGQSDEAPDCDAPPGPGESGHFSPWITTAFGEAGIWAQGPANRWQTNILDVEGTRLVIVAWDFPGTPPEDRAEMDAIIDSLVIEP